MGDPLDFGLGTASLAKLAAFAVDENRVRSDGQDRVSHGDARPGEVEDRRSKSPFVAPLFVPGPLERAHPGADIHLVYRRIEANPRETRRECPRIFGERLCDFRVLEVAEPGRDSEMAQVDDRLGTMVVQIGRGSSTRPQSYEPGPLKIR